MWRADTAAASDMRIVRRKLRFRIWADLAPIVRSGKIPPAGVSAEGLAHTSVRRIEDIVASSMTQVMEPLFDCHLPIPAIVNTRC